MGYKQIVEQCYWIIHDLHEYAHRREYDVTEQDLSRLDDMKVFWYGRAVEAGIFEREPVEIPAAKSSMGMIETSEKSEFFHYMPMYKQLRKKLKERSVWRRRNAT